MAISPQRLTIYLYSARYSAHRAVIFAIPQLSCFTLGLVMVTWLSGSALPLVSNLDQRIIWSG